MITIVTVCICCINWSIKLSNLCSIARSNRQGHPRFLIDVRIGCSTSSHRGHDLGLLSSFDVSLPPTLILVVFLSFGLGLVSLNLSLVDLKPL